MTASRPTGAELGAGSHAPLSFKVCMLGPMAVGKTSLVSRMVHSIFSERYLNTVGVKIDRKQMVVDGRQVGLVLWDIAGETTLEELRTSYLRGCAGCIVVADGTRPATIPPIIDMMRWMHDTIGDVPITGVINKTDAVEEFSIPPETQRELDRAFGQVHLTSARTGDGVEDVFVDVVRRILARRDSA
jgi:small GTP-binding protein